MGVDFQKSRNVYTEVQGQLVEVVGSFTYLGGVPENVSSAGKGVPNKVKQSTSDASVDQSNFSNSL